MADESLNYRVSGKVMQCRLPQHALEIVLTHLRWKGKTITCRNGVYLLTAGVPDVAIIARAWRDGAITLTSNCIIRVCTMEIQTGWDRMSIRRKVEDYLRRKASAEELICIAACLDVLK